MLNAIKLIFLRKLDFLNQSIILSLRRIMPSLKKSRIISLFHLWMKIFTLELMCLMKYLINTKPMVVKRGFGYINKDETPCSGETMFVKDKDDTLDQVESLKKTSLCTHRKKIGHSQFRCYTSFLEKWKRICLLSCTRAPTIKVPLTRRFSFKSI